MPIPCLLGKNTRSYIQVDRYQFLAIIVYPCGGHYQSHFHFWWTCQRGPFSKCECRLAVEVTSPRANPLESCCCNPRERKLMLFKIQLSLQPQHLELIRTLNMRPWQGDIAWKSMPEVGLKAQANKYQLEFLNKKSLNSLWSWSGLVQWWVQAKNSSTTRHALSEVWLFVCRTLPSSDQRHQMCHPTLLGFRYYWVKCQVWITC